MPSQSRRLSGSLRESAEEKIRDVQPATIEVRCCGTCGRRSTGSFFQNPPMCQHPLNTEPQVIALYRLVAVSDG